MFLSSQDLKIESSLTFEFSSQDLQRCSKPNPNFFTDQDRSEDNLEIVKQQEFTAVNLGNLPIKIESISIDNIPW